jgi:aspartate racemase
MIVKNTQRETWGILGGMGPLASAEFLKTVYEHNTHAAEQETPRVVLLSDPTMPDRTEALLNGRQELLLQRFTEGLNQLVSMRVSRIVVCCVTIHPLLRQLPPWLREKIVSLVDLVFANLLQNGRKHLLICTEGTRKMRVFQNHHLWAEAAGHIVLPDDEDQALIHQMIYSVKLNQRDMGRIRFLESLLEKYGVSSYIAGCTELHIVAKEHELAIGKSRQTFCVDPLTDVAAMMSHDLAMAGVC